MKIEKRCKDCNGLLGSPEKCKGILLLHKSFDYEIPVDLWICTKCLKVELYLQEERGSG